MEHATDKAENNSFPRKTLALIGGLAMGAFAYVDYVSRVIKANVSNAMSFKDRELIDYVDGYRKQPRDAMQALYPADILTQMDESFREISATLAQPHIAETAHQREEIYEALDKTSVLGSARQRALRRPEVSDILKETVQTNRTYLQLKEMQKARYKGVETYNAADATVTDEAFSALYAKHSKQANALFESKKTLAGLVAAEVPLAEKISMKNLHFTPDQKIRSGLAFATVAALSMVAIYALGGLVGKEKSDLKVKR